MTVLREKKKIILPCHMHQLLLARWMKCYQISWFCADLSTFPLVGFVTKNKNMLRYSCATYGNSILSKST
jgi:hypothetical protein